MGAAGGGLQWHHIAEQTGGNIARFGSEAIHNTGNLIRLETETHQAVSAFYSSIQPFSDGMRVRQWLSPQSLAAQQAFGRQVLMRFGVAF
jgi:hypothetical protein